MAEQTESVSFQTPGGQSVDVDVPSGLSDEQVRAYIRKNRPELFRQPESGFMRGYHAVGENIKAPFQGAANIAEDILAVTKDPEGISAGLKKLQQKYPPKQQGFLQTMADAYKSAGRMLNPVDVRKTPSGSVDIPASVGGTAGNVAVLGSVPEFREMASEGIANLPKKVMRALTGNTVSQTREVVADTVKANEKILAKHASAVEKVEAANQAGTQAVARREVLQRQLDKESAEFQKGIQNQVAKDGPARQVANEKYAAVRKGVGETQVPPGPLADAVRHAKESIIKGVPETTRQFEDILQRSGEMEGPGTGAEKRVAETLGYDSVEDARDGLGTRVFSDLAAREESGSAKVPLLELMSPNASPLTFDDLKGYKTELDRMLHGPRVGSQKGDLYRAVAYVRDEVSNQLRDMAEKAGVSKELGEADAYYSRMMKLFYGKGSPIAGALGHTDPGKSAGAMLRESTEAKSLEKLREFSPELADRGEFIRKLNKEMKPLPTKYTPKPPPAPPELKTIGPEELQESKHAGVKKAASRARFAGYIGTTISAWRGVKGLAHGDLGAVAEAVLDAGGMVTAGNTAAYILERPRVMDWITRPEPADLRELAKLPPEMQKRVNGSLSALVTEAESKGRQVSPQLKAYLAGRGAQEGER